MSIALEWPRVEGMLLPLLRAEFTGLTISNIKPKQTPPYECVLIRADLQQKVNAISRYCRIGVSAWSVRASGEPNFQAAHDIAAAIGKYIETLPDAGGTPLITADIESGPLRLKDDLAGQLEFAYLSVLTIVSATV